MFVSLALKSQQKDRLFDEGQEIERTDDMFTLIE